MLDFLEHMENFINQLETEFKRNANAAIAAGQKAYLKGQFEFYGITTPVRRELQKPFLVREYLPHKTELEGIVKTLWDKPQREYQMFAQELVRKYIVQIEERDLVLFEFMVVNKSWWETVDFIAPKLMGPYFKRYPAQVTPYLEKWIDSGNIWLQRSAILFQLDYKQSVNVELLAFVIHSLLGSKEFFINKAIGWMLRNYSRINPGWVIEFVDGTPLHPLSRREALRLIQ